MYVSEICAEGIFVTFPWWLKNVKNRSKIALFFQMSAILKFDFQKREQLRFSEVNYLNYTKRPNFARGNYIFPKTRGKKNKPWTHSTPLNSSMESVKVTSEGGFLYQSLFSISLSFTNLIDPFFYCRHVTVTGQNLKNIIPIVLIFGCKRYL